MTMNELLSYLRDEIRKQVLANEKGLTESGRDIVKHVCEGVAGCKHGRNTQRISRQTYHSDDVS